MLSAAAITVGVSALTQGDIGLGVAFTLLIAWIGAAILGVVKVLLLRGYNDLTVSITKALAKVPTGLGIVVGLTTTALFKVNLTSALVPGLAALMLFAAGVLAELLANVGELGWKDRSAAIAASDDVNKAKSPGRPNC